MDSLKNIMKTENQKDQSQTSNEPSKVMVCKNHGEYEVSVIKAGKREIKQTQCPKCVEENLLKREQWENKQKYDELIRNSGIEKRYLNCTLDSFICSNTHQENIVKHMRKYIEKYDDVKKNGTSFIFSGLPGTGKTHLACAISLDIIKKQNHAHYTSVYTIMSQIKSTFNKKSEETENQIIQMFINKSFLIIDEIGVQTGSDYEKAILFQIINGRYGKMLPTILITNLNESDAKETIGERIIDRFYENGGGFYNFNWESHRRKRKIKKQEEKCQKKI